MPWNPSPKVAVARDYSLKFNKEMVIIISINNDQLGCVTYGKTKKLCKEAEVLGDIAYDAIYREYEKGK